MAKSKSQLKQDKIKAIKVLGGFGTPKEYTGVTYSDIHASYEAIKGEIHSKQNSNIVTKRSKEVSYNAKSKDTSI